MIRIGPNEDRIIKEISDRINIVLGSVGLFFRLFYRIKTPESFKRKISEKGELYKSRKLKMQDVFGLRITLYFSDDESIAIELVKRIFEEIPESHSIDLPDGETFGPSRCNLIFKVPDDLSNSSAIFEQEFIDKTFEIQFRTVFSEGWHEVEHDLRYKCKEDWRSQISLSRQLNGQLATLESSNWTLLKIFDELAYSKYRESEWSSFFRNVMRIRFVNDRLSADIINILNKDKKIAKELLRRERNELILPIASLTVSIPLVMDHVLFIINRQILGDKTIRELEPELLSKIFDNSFAS
jgi:putative GTP pyrophosphokinase